jgi:hypothetical protein
MKDDGTGILFYGLAVDAVGKTLLDNDGVTEVTFGLSEEIADRN